MSSDDKETKEMILEPKLEAQGTYGCIFHPGITCDGHTEDIKYVSKIQKTSEENTNEIQIGEIIKTIDNYDLYFAPIISSCELEIAKIKNDDIEKCEIMKEKVGAFRSNKIRFVGKKDVFDYLSENPTGIKRVHSHLLEALRILSSKNIVHYDLKYNNIMYDEINHIPIIIDFGLSHQYPFDMNTHFYVYSPGYEPWTIDIAMASYIQDNPNSINSKIYMEKIDEILNEYVEKNPMFKLFTKPTIKKWLSEHHEFFKKYEEKQITWNELCIELCKYYKTWDNYALSIIILKIMNKVKPNEPKYTKLLKDIIKSTPDKRLTVESTQTKLLQSKL
jgi:serine/threonine protein kinase